MRPSLPITVWVLKCVHVFFKSLKTYFTFDEISCSDYPTLRVNDSPSSTDPPGRNTPTPQAARSSDIGVHVMGLFKTVGKNIGETKTYGLYWFRNIFPFKIYLNIEL